MAIQQYATQAGRINKLKGEILAHAAPVEVLGITGQQKTMPKNNGDTIVFRRWLPYGTSSSAISNGIDPASRWITYSNVGTFAGNHLTSDGTTPTADTLTPVDVQVALQQYTCLYAVTDKTVDLYEDDVPGEMKKQTGERMGLVREMVRYGALKGASNVFYGGTGTTRGTVNGTVTINLLRKIARSLLGNHAKQITSILEASPKFSTAPVEAGFLVFCHSDLEPAIRDLAGFKHVSEYGSRKVINENEIGSVERFRFILSPELAQYNDAGASVGSTALYSTGASNIDVYPMIVVGEDAWGDVALRGASSFDVTWIPPGQKDKNDPLGQRGYIGAKFYGAATVLNQGWMAVAEVGTPSL